MDSLVSAAARALAGGDALGALRCVALRDDPAALALRGIALARLGDLSRARGLLKRAARRFGPREARARARCLVADAEVALAMRDIEAAPRQLARATDTLAALGDTVNAAYARLVAVRRLLLLGRLQPAREALARLDGQALPAALAAAAQLAAAELCMRSLQVETARTALASAQAAAMQARVPALIAEVEALSASLDRPAARAVSREGEWPLRLGDVAALLASDVLVVDGCRRGLRHRGGWVPLARRPVLFALLQSLAAAWPGEAARDALIADAFRLRHPDDTHRARLRVDIGRLRALLKPWAAIEPGSAGFRLVAPQGRSVVRLVPPIDGAQASLLALLSDGEAWSTSALALALGASQRSVQRTLAELSSAGAVSAIGHARARRWLAPPLHGFATTLLLPASSLPA